MGFQSPRFCHYPQLLLRQFVYGGSCYCGRNFIYHMVCQLVVIFLILNRIIQFDGAPYGTGWGLFSFDQARCIASG